MSTKHDSEYTSLDALSTPMLELLVRESFSGDDSNLLPPETIEYIASLLFARAQADGSAEEVDVNAAWDSFQTDWLDSDSRRPAEDADSNAEPLAFSNVVPFPAAKEFSDTGAANVAPKKRRGKRARHIIAAILAAAFCATSIAAVAFDINIIALVGQWTDRHFTFAGPGNLPIEGLDLSNTSGIEDCKSPQEAFDFIGLKGTLLPTWYPDGYLLNEFQLDDFGGEIDMYACHNRGNGDYIAISVNIADKPEYMANVSYPKDPGDVEEYTRGETTYYIFGNLNRNVVAWTNGTAQFSIIGTVSRDILRQMVDSMY